MERYSISNFGLKHATLCSSIIRKMGKNSRSIEDTAGKIVEFLFNSFIDEISGERELALVRLFVTRAFNTLDENLMKFACNFFTGQAIAANTKCLTLLATAGENEDWMDREKSSGHKAIPLCSEEIVDKLPMIRNLIKQLGLEVRTVISPDPDLIQDIREKNHNIFYVPNAKKSSYITAQKEFVEPYHIESALGFGGVYREADIFTVIIFSKKFTAIP